MLDRKVEQMLNIAMMLTADEIDEIHASQSAGAVIAAVDDESTAEEHDSLSHPIGEQASESDDDEATSSLVIALTTGERERLRTRESKVSTACVGQAREPHAWWPIGTELEGRINGEVFHASVVANPRVKSGRSILIDSGPAQGRVCITPTRAAMEATESYRQLTKIGRGGGVTNGWGFWKPKQ